MVVCHACVFLPNIQKKKARLNSYQATIAPTKSFKLRQPLPPPHPFHRTPIPRDENCNLEPAGVNHFDSQVIDYVHRAFSIFPSGASFAHAINSLLIEN